MFNKKSGSELNKEEVRSLQTASEQPAPKTQTVIGEGICFEGDFITEEEINVKGKIKGSLLSATSVNINESGEIEGEVKALNLYVEGTAKGELKIKYDTILGDKASIIGDLTTKKLITSDNSYFEGKLFLPALERKKAEEAAKAAAEAGEVPDATEIEY